MADADADSDIDGSNAKTLILTPDEILFKGLALVGFDKKRQGRVGIKKNLSRFRSHYGMILQCMLCCSQSCK